MTQAAMDDTVTERGEPPVAEPISGPPQYRREHLARHNRQSRAQIRRCDDFAIGPGGARRRMYADPVHLPGENPPLSLVDAEFEGGGTGIDHADQRLCR